MEFQEKIFSVHKIILLALGLLIVGGLSTTSPLNASQGETLKAFTGQHTKVVWITQEGRVDTYARGDKHQLWGIDSIDGTAKAILSIPGSYHRPLISPDGKQIIYSDRVEGVIYAVDWDGTNRRLLGAGAAASFWTDPATGVVYVYAQAASGQTVSPIVRFPFHSPEEREEIWNVTPVEVLTPGSFQLSRDGTRAASVFPWPNSGIALLDEGDLIKHRDGCWPGMAPDNSHMYWTFDGSHKILFLHRPGNDEDVRMDLSQAPGIGGQKVYHPRWTNHVQFFVMTGPYDEDGDHTHPVDIHLGKFDAEFSGIAAWHQITDMDAPAYFPDVWIKDGAVADSGIVAVRQAAQEPERKGFFGKLRSRVSVWFSDGEPELGDRWPGTEDGLVFLWESNAENNHFTNDDGVDQRVELTLEKNARFGPDGQLHLLNGAARVPNEIATGIAGAVRESNALTFEAIVETHAVNQSGPARIVSHSQSTTKRNFLLGQEQDHLVFRLRTSDTNDNGQDFILGTIEPGKPVHVLVTYRPGRLVAFMNGKRTNSFTFEAGDLTNWEDYELIFGNELKNDRFWHGYLDGIAISSRFTSEDETIARHKLAEERIRSRTQPNRFAVEAKLMEPAAPPSPESIDPYRRALVVNEYQVTSTEDPALKGKNILVAEWALLDRKVPADYAGLKSGQARTLVLEEFAQHPQLESERKVGETPSFELPLYYHVFSGS